MTEDVSLQSRSTAFLSTPHDEESLYKAPVFSPLSRNESPVDDLSGASDIEEECTVILKPIIPRHLIQMIWRLVVPTAETEDESSWCGYKFVGDNVDKNVKPTRQRHERHGQSLHYFIHTLQRVCARDQFS